MTTQIFILACTLALEAGGEQHAGRWMVGQVIANQAHIRNMTPSKVCFVPKLFSCWNNGIPKKRIKKMVGSEVWKDCVQIATEIMQPGFKTISPVTNYYNPSKASPSWAKRMRLVAIVGNHRFYCAKETP